MLFFCISCGGEKIPDGVVVPKLMPALLTDMHLADGQLASIPIDSARMRRDGYYQAIFQRYNIDSVVFRKSIEFYSSRPYLMNEFYDDVEKQLETLNQAEQQRIDKKYAAQRRADSIRNVRETDSLRRIARDSLDFKRKRYLLFLHAPDSLYGEPDSVTFTLLHERMLETIRLGETKVVRQKRPSVPNPTPPSSPKESPAVSQKSRLRPLEKIK